MSLNHSLIRDKIIFCMHANYAEILNQHLENNLKDMLPDCTIPGGREKAVECMVNDFHGGVLSEISPVSSLSLQSSLCGLSSHHTDDGDGSGNYYDDLGGYLIRKLSIVSDWLSLIRSILCLAPSLMHSRI